MPVGEQEFLVRITLEMVVATQVGHRGRLVLRRSGTLGSMSEDLASEFQPVAWEGVLQQESAVREVMEVLLRNDRFSGAAVHKPGAKIFLQPDRQFVPDFAHPKALVGATGRQFEHGERA